MGGMGNETNPLDLFGPGSGNREQPRSRDKCHEDRELRLVVRSDDRETLLTACVAPQGQIVVSGRGFATSVVERLSWIVLDAVRGASHRIDFQ